MHDITTHRSEVRIAIIPEIEDNAWMPTEEEEKELLKIQNVESVESQGLCWFCVVLNYPSPAMINEMIALQESEILEVVTRHHKNNTTTCLNCGTAVTYEKKDVKHDSLGEHLICPECESSFNI